jgi:ribosomal protein S3
MAITMSAERLSIGRTIMKRPASRANILGACDALTLSGAVGNDAVVSGRLTQTDAQEVAVSRGGNTGAVCASVLF